MIEFLNENRTFVYQIDSIEAVDLVTGELYDGIFDLKDLQYRYSQAFIFKYKHSDATAEHLTNRFFKNKTAVSWFLASLDMDIKPMKTVEENRKNEYLKEINKLEKTISKNRDKIAKAKTQLSKTKSAKQKEKYKATIKHLSKSNYNLHQESAELNRLYKRGIIFGSRSLYKYLNKLHYIKTYVYPKYQHITNPKKFDKLISKTDDAKIKRELQQAKSYSEELLFRKTANFKNNRLRPIFISGETNRFANRMFKFHQLSNNIVYFRYNNIVYKITFKSGKYQQEQLQMLTTLAANSLTPITVKLDLRDDNKTVQFSVAVNVLYDYLIDKDSIDKELSETKITFDNWSSIYKIYAKYTYKVQKRKYSFKLNRCLAIDMNPDNIGVAVVQRTGAHTCRVIYAETIYYPKLIERLGLKSSDPESIHQNNKQHHELIEIAHYLITLMLHYKCSMFVCEDLNFKSDNEKKKSKEANRKIHNKWMRNLLLDCIKKLCSINHIRFREVNPCYTSFIGNIQHPFSDSASAACEIGRRGLFKFIGSQFYPYMSASDLATLKNLYPEISDELDITCVRTWCEIFQILKANYDVFEINRRFRNLNVHANAHKYSFESYRSKVKRKVFDCSRKQSKTQKLSCDSLGGQ